MTGGIVEVALVQWSEAERLASQALEMHVGDARTMLADHRGDITAGRGQMRGIGAEPNRGQSENPVDFGRTFDDRREMGVIVGL